MRSNDQCLLERLGGGMKESGERRKGMMMMMGG